MLLYLPERIYNNVLKDDETYANMANEATEKVFVDDFVKSMINYDDDNPYLKELEDYIIEKSPEEYQMELKLCFDDDLEKYEDQYDDMDIETKMYWLCEVNGGDMKPSKKFDERNIKFLRLYNQFVSFEPENYSNFIHMMYYAKVIYQQIMKENEKKDITIDDVKEYIKFEEQIYNQCLRNINDIRYYNMLYSKREQMYVFYFEFVGVNCDKLAEVIDMIANRLYQGKFKYNKFTYFRLLFNFICFQRYVDNGDVDNSKKHWAKMADLINYAFNHREFTIKSLNHYNNSFLDEFLDIAKFLYTIEKTYIPSKYMNIDHLMTQKEKRFFTNNLSRLEKPLIEKHILHNTLYSYEWAEIKKVMLGLLD